MTSPYAVVDIQDEGAGRKLARLKGRFANYEPVLNGPVRELIRSFTQEQFDTEGRANGLSGWAAVIDRNRKYPGLPILQQTGELMRSFVFKNDPNQEVIVTPHGITYRSLVRYGGVHQMGAPRIPQRQIIPDQMPDAFMTALKKIVTNYFVSVEFGG